MLSSTHLHRLALGFGVAGATLLAVSTASAFFCYVPETPNSPVALRDKPDAQAKIVARLTPGTMVREATGKSQHKEWVRVLWYKSQGDAKPAARGWVVHTEIHGGECED
jgi:hypothetical protein